MYRVFRLGTLVLETSQEMDVIEALCADSRINIVEQDGICFMSWDWLDRVMEG